MKLPKKIKIAAFLMASLFLTGCGSQVNIGYVDGNRVMEEAPQIKAIIDEGQKKAAEIQDEAAATLDENSELTDEERQKATEDIQRKFMGIQQAYSTQLQHKLDEAFSSIAQEKNLDVVVDSSEANPTVFLGGIDVTEDVIKKLQ